VIEEIDGMFVRREEPADGGVAGGEQKSRPGRLDQQRLDIGAAPDVIDDDQGGFARDGGPVVIRAGEGRVPVSGIFAQSTGHLAHLGEEVTSGFAARGEPHYAVGEGAAHNGVVGRGLGEHRFTDAAHAGERGERDRLAAIFGEDGVAEGMKDRRAVEVIGDARRSGEVGDLRGPEVFGERAGGVAVDIVEKLSELFGEAVRVGKIAKLPGIEVNGPEVFLCDEDGNNALALVKGEELLGAADFKGVGAGAQESEQDVAGSDFAELLSHGAKEWLNLGHSLIAFACLQIRKKLSHTPLWRPRLPTPRAVPSSPSPWAGWSA
jgi:hypothetical protein